MGLKCLTNSVSFFLLTYLPFNEHKNGQLLKTAPFLTDKYL